ncbi:MAG: aminoglycoside phosphotransferase family protein [bacterium]|nr:aminoglycoside phosphotransferase family protein [Gammaproteobacteria bacterium]HIL95939.1 aminoglycoside phosphotransferase family protein [Pseudomonadales bacterium]
MAENWSNEPAVVALRVSRQLLRDRIFRPKAVSLEDVPSSVEAITPAWWTAIFCRDTPAAQVIGQRLLTLSKGTHERHRFELSYNDAGQAAGLPEAIFTKSLPTLVTRMIGGYNGTARAEGRFYMRIRPELEIETPLGYHAAFDRRTLAGVNVLEDIAATRNAQFCDFRTRVSRQMAEDMVDLLASLHGHLYDHPRLDAEFRWVANFADWFRIGAGKMKTERYTQAAIKRAGELIPRDIAERRAQIWPATIAAARIHQTGPRCLLHSDVHIGNWYQTGGGAMGLCDWQCLTQGHWSRDLSYLLSTALTPEDRRDWERDLLQRYLEGLSAAVGGDIAFGPAWDQYRRQMLHAFWMWTITLCHSPFLPAMQSEETSLAMVSRIATAMSDLDSLLAPD